MFKVLVNVYHSYPAVEHIAKFYADWVSAIRYMETVSSKLNAMQIDGSVVSYDIHFDAGIKED